MALVDDVMLMNGNVRFGVSVHDRCVMLIAAAIVAWMVGTGAALAERRLAFVVGINTYAHLGSDAQLQRAVSDAESISARLSTLDFTVTTLAARTQVDQDLFLRRFAAWTRSIEPGDFAVFYFAGHGIGINNANYLVPADIPDLKEADEYTFRAHAIAETEIRDRIKESGARVTVLMLDACRNNPFGSNGRSVALSRGLQPIEPTKGVLTIYSAGYGQTALDRLSDRGDPNPNSVFTRVLLTELQKPGENLLDLSENIRDEVANLAQSVGHDQIPAVDNQLLGGRTIYLVKPEPAAPTPPDDVMWSAIQSSNDPASLRRFLETYPASRHRAAVESRLASLENPAPSSPASESSAEDVAWHYLGATTDPAALRRFIVDYPSSRHQNEARSLLASLGGAAWQRARDSNRADDLRGFLKDFPGSPSESLAAAKLQSLDDAAWASAATGSRAAIAQYLNVFPEGRHRAAADQRRADLEASKPAIAFPRSIVTSTPAPRVAKRSKPVAGIRHATSVKPPPLRPVAALRPPRDVKAPTNSHCFEVNGDRYCQ